MEIITQNWEYIAIGLACVVALLGLTDVGSRMVDTVLTRLAQFLLVIAALLGFFLAFVVCADVGGRYFFSSPIQGTPEIVSMAIVMICYLQAAYAIRSGGMINVDALYIHMPTRMKGVVAVFGSLLGFALFALIFWGSWDRAVTSFVAGEFEGEGAMRIPAWPTRWILVTGAGLASLTYLLLSIKQLGALIRGEVPPTVSSAH